MIYNVDTITMTIIATYSVCMTLIQERKSPFYCTHTYIRLVSYGIITVIRMLI